MPEFVSPLILASQSPRRKELLDAMGLAGRYRVIPSSFEEVLDNTRTPQEVAKELGYGKALWVARHNPGVWVIGSDTIVTIDGKQLGKPADLDEARQMLTSLANKTNTVTTSIALVRVAPGAVEGTEPDAYIGYEDSTVHFSPYDQEAVEAYLATGDWHDKAGAYGIQSGAHTLMDYMQGNYDTIVGLPTRTLAEFLREIGIQASPVELEAPLPVRS